MTDASTRLFDAPYLLFLGDCTEAGYAKTAFGLRDWAGENCIGECALPAATVSAGLERMDPAQAAARGARSLVIGIANVGGVIPDSWLPTLEAALDAGLDVVGGMHARLADIPALADAARRTGRRLVDVRVPPANLPIANGRKRTGKRLLTVGTDCALGKKYTALAIARGMKAKGVDADFRATGQTGIMIAGGGIPMDAVIADFAAGAAELLSPDAAPDHWDVIEGQGAITHPAYAGVSLALLHGSQPDVFVVCHQPGRGHVLGYPDHPVPDILAVVEQTVALGRLTNPKIRCGGVALNTAAYSDEVAAALIAAEAERTGLAVADPIRGGAPFEALIAACLAA